MKVKSIKLKSTNETVYDIETPCHNYILANGLVSHNSFDMYNPLEIGGGRGIYFASSSIVLGTSKARAKETESSTEIIGAKILATTKKSRFCKELTKLRYLIKYDGGIHPTYGILDDACEGGFVEKPTMGYYSRPCVPNDKKWREREIWDKSSEFWTPVIKETEFRQFVEAKYTFLHSEIADEDFEFSLKITKG